MRCKTDYAPVSEGDLRRELDERSCCRPALTAAAACKEIEAVRLGDGEDEPSGCRDAADSLPLGLVLAVIAEADEEGGGCVERSDGGRELRSGMLAQGLSFSISSRAHVGTMYLLCVCACVCVAVCA